ncbi:PQQ-binding-like beta-propeller repeat protein, partial [Streptomyces sp. CLV115]|uniref:outer membrane protein assembly factor BamB family protein n=1 Tax=Streptomyces sp. CLV115 TaxID=3138502 RepID=UPI00313C042B
VLLPGLFEGSGGGDGNAGGGVRPTASASDAVRTKAGPAVIPGADAGHTGDFGAAATDVSAKPADWKAWKAKVENGPVKCVLAGASLACGGPRRITVLDAATGERRWRTPQGSAGGGPASVAAVVGTTVYAFQDGGLVALGLADGARKWREPLAEGTRVTGFVQSDGVLYYATKGTGTGTARIIAHQLTGAHSRTWDKPWDDPAAEAELLFADGRLVAVGDAITVLKGADGARLGAIGAGDLICRTPVLKGKELLCAGSNGLTVVDVMAPQNRRTIAEGVDIAYRPAVSRDGKVVVSSRTRVYAFGLADGRQYWATYDGGPGLDTTGGPALAGDTAVVVGGYGLNAFDMASTGEADDTGSRLPDEWPGEPGDALDPASISLIARGDAVFLSFGDGSVISLNAP